MPSWPSLGPSVVQVVPQLGQTKTAVVSVDAQLGHGTTWGFVMIFLGSVIYRSPCCRSGHCAGKYSVSLTSRLWSACEMRQMPSRPVYSSVGHYMVAVFADKPCCWVQPAAHGDRARARLRNRMSVDSGDRLFLRVCRAALRAFEVGTSVGVPARGTRQRSYCSHCCSSPVHFGPWPCSSAASIHRARSARAGARSRFSLPADKAPE